jgi:hypothetical protein
MNPADTVTTLTRIAIAAFAIDRIVTAVMFLLSYLSAFSNPTLAEGDARATAEKNYKMLYFFFAGVLALAVLIHYPQMRLLEALRIKENAILDALVTGIVLVAGTDRIAAWLKSPGTSVPEKPAVQPIQVVGKLTLEEGTAKRIAAGQGL